MKRQLLISAVFCSLTLFSLACSNNAVALFENSQAQIYGSVITQLYQDYGDFGGPTKAYIMTYTDDSAGMNSSTTNSTVIPQSLQKAVVTSLANTQKTYIWVSQASEIPRDVKEPTSCQIILGNIHSQKDGSVQVTASLFFGGTGGGGTTYILKYIDGVWKVTGKTGASWIS